MKVHKVLPFRTKVNDVPWKTWSLPQTCSSSWTRSGRNSASVSRPTHPQQSPSREPDLCKDTHIPTSVSGCLFVGPSSHLVSQLASVWLAVETGHCVHVVCWSLRVSTHAPLGHRVRCLHRRMRRDARPLRRSSLSLCWCDSLCQILTTRALWLRS